jgi:poly(hydroxyalkanoate) depolymerase family esterase
MTAMRRCRAELTISLALLLTCLAAPAARAGTTSPLTNFGSNPKNLPMYLYTPTNVGTKPPILVHLHACHATNGGQSMCSSGNAFAQQADKYGFYMVCPSAVSTDQCWDVHSTADLTHGGTGSDVEGIMSAVNYVIANKNGDGNRVYAAGYSSGGMMTNVLLGSYPDVFKAGAAFAGVPFGCFAQGSVDSLGWSSTCANGKVTMTAAQWGDLVRAAYPGFTGTRPRIQLWHGSVDTTVNPANFTNEIAQWTNVLGVSGTPTTTENNVPQSGWIRTRYTDGAGVVQVEAIQETGKGHGDLVVDPMAAEAIRFLGLDGTNPVPDGGATKDGAPDAAKLDTAGSTGGIAGTGGVAATGGASGTGGAIGSGGTVGTGGTAATGGTSGKGGTTGTTGTGGVLASGGTSGRGGTMGTGGAASSGGISGAGGAASMGGSVSSGGSASTGGAASGGTTSTGGSAATAGGTSTSSQGTGGTNGASSGGSAGTSANNGSPAGGCSCALSGGNPDRFAPAGLLLTLGMLIFRRRRRDKK